MCLAPPAIDLPSHSSLEALEVLSGTLPIDLRREEMAIRELGKINSYSNNVPIKRKFEIWKEEENPEKFISPLGITYQQTEDMRDTELVDINKIEPQYEYQGLVSVIRAPDLWRNIGSSKSRTTAQIQEGKQIISEQLKSQTPNTAFTFTDGSCLGNPGPCDAGSIIYINDQEEKLKRPVSNKGSILLAELLAIKIVLDYIESFSKAQIDTLTLFSDSQTALGHASINDEADSLAKESAKEAEILAVDDIVFTKQDVKKAARNSLINLLTINLPNAENITQLLAEYIEETNRFSG
ncbi:Hypothetical predicted protein [Mytilus galloprovincialis]|uniref:RNase H type-1 domain-containing protein n=1 Tax=Mytilus galloprovincialis TaxID=29158 RepID=A0A8B6HJB8_MYTGA|nr:Hypothetical predicted protein [Mytilus galloprovincialis]